MPKLQSNDSIHKQRRIVHVVLLLALSFFSSQAEALTDAKETKDYPEVVQLILQHCSNVSDDGMDSMEICSCSGVYVGPHTILTAAHCVAKPLDVERPIDPEVFPLTQISPASHIFVEGRENIAIEKVIYSRDLEMAAVVLSEPTDHYYPVSVESPSLEKPKATLLGYGSSCLLGCNDGAKRVGKNAIHSFLSNRTQTMGIIETLGTFTLTEETFESLHRHPKFPLSERPSRYGSAGVPGDSGGPLLTKEGGRFTVAGILSLYDLDGWVPKTIFEEINQVRPPSESIRLVDRGAFREHRSSFFRHIEGERENDFFIKNYYSSTFYAQNFLKFANHHGADITFAGSTSNEVEPSSNFVVQGYPVVPQDLIPPTPIAELVSTPISLVIHLACYFSEEWKSESVLEFPLEPQERTFYYVTHRREQLKSEGYYPFLRDGLYWDNKHFYYVVGFEDGYYFLPKRCAGSEKTIVH